MPNLTQKLRNFFAARLMPRRRRAVLSPIHGEPNQASLVDADTLHAIISEAEQGRTKRLFALYRDIVQSDSHILQAFMTRKMAVLNKEISVNPVDAKNAADVRAADECRALIHRIPQLRFRLAELLEGTLYPVSVVEKAWKHSDLPGLRFDLASLVHQDPQLLDYRDGVMKLEGVDPATRMPNNTFEVVDGHDFIIHRGHLMTSPDNWGGPMRSLVFWWLFSIQNRDWWARFLSRFGSPFMVGHYPTGDDESRWTLETAFSAAAQLFGVAVSDETKIEVHEVSATHGDAFEKFWTTAQREKSKLILGQTLSSDSSPTGLGNGASNLQGEVRHDIEQLDGVLLGETLRAHLLTPFLQINGIGGSVPLVVFSTDDAVDAKAFAETLKTATEAGWEPTDEATTIIATRLGYPVQRKASPAPIPALFAASDRILDPGDRIATAAAPDLAQAFRGHLAPIRQMLRESTSPADFEQRIRTFYADWSPGQIAGIVAESLAAYTVNGAVAHPSG